MKSVYRDSFEQIREMTRAVEGLADLLKNPSEARSSDLDQQMSRIQEATDQYFAAAGIQVQKQVANVQIGSIKDDAKFEFYYNVYQMKGSRTGDEIARMMYGVQSNPKFSKNPVTFTFDPLYLLNFGRGGMLAHFHRQQRAVVIGPHVLTMSTAGIAEVFRHEIHHYFENIKVLTGKMSLQRIMLGNPQGAKNKNYGDLLSVDEAETHLRDWRAIRSENRIDTIDTKLKDLVPPDARMEILGERMRIEMVSISNLKQILTDSMGMIPVIKKLTQEKKWTEIGNEETGGTFVMFETPGQEYSHVGINVQGLVNEKSSPEQIRDAVLKVLEWSDHRIQQINSEVN